MYPFIFNDQMETAKIGKGSYEGSSQNKKTIVSAVNHALLLQKMHLLLKGKTSLQAASASLF